MATTQNPLFLYPEDGAVLNENMKKLASYILDGIADESFKFDEDEGGYVIPLGDTLFILPDDTDDLAVLSEVLENTLSEVISEEERDFALDCEVKSIDDSNIVVC